MKFNCSVDIDLPVDEMVALLDNPENMKEWQDGFQSMTHISGTPGEEGAVSSIQYKNGRHSFELVETLLVHNIPHEISGLYKSKHTVNTMKNFFEPLGADKCRWNAEMEYTELNGFMIKFMARFMPGMFKKQTQKWMDQFKEFAESQN